MSASDVAIVTAVVFVWGSAVRAAGTVRRDRADHLRARWPAADPRPAGTAGFHAPSRELVKALAEITLVLVLFSDASRVRLRDLRTRPGLCLRLLGIGLPLTIGLGTPAGARAVQRHEHLARPAGGRGPRADRRRPERGRDGQPGGPGPDPPAAQRRERAQRRDRHAGRPGRHSRSRDCRARCQRRPGARRLRNSRWACSSACSPAARAASW